MKVCVERCYGCSLGFRSYDSCLELQGFCSRVRVVLVSRGLQHVSAFTALQSMSPAPAVSPKGPGSTGA